MANIHIVVVLGLIIALLFVPKRHVVTVGTASVLISAGLLEGASHLLKGLGQ